MYLMLLDRVRRRLSDSLRAHYDLKLDDLPLETPRSDMGDLASPIAFELARKKLGKPREIAERLANDLAELEDVGRVAVAGAGYINIFLERGTLLRGLLAEVSAPAAAGPARSLAGGGKTIVEHTNINPNKAAHIGHLRNAVLGDTLARVLRRVGAEVEVQNYIDDTGVQVADVVVGFEDLEQLSLTEVRGIPEPFDHYCWDLYARVTRHYEDEPDRKQRRLEVLRSIEAGANPTAELAAHVAHRIVGRHLATMTRISVGYDLLAWEGDILRLDLWSHAFDKLKQTDGVALAKEGKNKGCWVLKLSESEGFRDLEEPDKVLVRSDGTVTYVAKDIAYQMWKFGLLGVDFRYVRLDAAEAADELWSTTSGQGEPPPAEFGHADRVFNVIDTRQSYLQAVVAEGLRVLGHPEHADRSIHFAYEMVALTPACCEELGIELSEEDRARPYVEMSGRRGMGIKADDLLDTLVRLATHEVAERHSELGEEAASKIAREIAVGCLRYFMLRFSRNKVVAFDFKEALNFRGETGAYLLNSVVRARSIFRKLAEREGRNLSDPAGFDGERDLSDFSELEADAEFWELVLALARLDEVLEQALEGPELSLLAKYAFRTSQKFHRFYDRYRLVGEPDSAVRQLRAVAISLYLSRMTEVLGLMGIDVPERM